MPSPIDLRSPSPTVPRSASPLDSDDEPIRLPHTADLRLTLPVPPSHSPSPPAGISTGSGMASPSSRLSNRTRWRSPNGSETDGDLAHLFGRLEDEDQMEGDDDDIPPRRQAGPSRPRSLSVENESGPPSRLGSLLYPPRRVGAGRILSPDPGEEGISVTLARRAEERRARERQGVEAGIRALPPPIPAAAEAQITGAERRRRAIIQAMEDRREERQGRRVIPLPSRARAGGRESGLWMDDGSRDRVVIDLLDDSDEEEFTVTGANIHVPPPRPLHMGQQGSAPGQAQGGQGQARFPQAGQAIQRLDAVLEERRRQTEAILNEVHDANDDRRRAVLSPPVQLPRIRLGGAVLRSGNRQINYQPNPATGEVAQRAQIGRPPSPPRVNRAGRLFGEIGLGVGGGGLFDRLMGLFPGMTGANPAQMADFLVGGLPMFGAGGAGPAGSRRDEDVRAIIASVPDFDYPDPTKGFTRDFEITSTEPISIDENGAVVPTSSTDKPYLACANCSERLRLSSAYRSPADRIWALRCGHLIDQRCLDTLFTPTTSAELASVLPPMGELLDVPVRKGRKKAKIMKKDPQRTFAWRCPVKGCGRMHCSTQAAGQEEWRQKEGEGALQVYA